MWILKEEKALYNDSKINGLRLHFCDGVSVDNKKICIDFCNWMRKYYWFPIRCNLIFSPLKKFHFKSKRGFCYGVFFSNKEYKSRRYPQIYIATNFNTEEDEYNCLITIAHELTHYFQWYFYEDEKNTERSLEIIANKWANYIVEEYLNK